MKALVHHKYGTPDVLELRDVDKPALTDDGVLVRVNASSVNPAEWYAVTGRPYLARPAMGLRGPKDAVLGADFAGTVEAVCSAVTGFRPGDAVFGGTSSGAFAEYVCGCSTKNVDLVRSIGADQVIDYTRDDFTRSGQRYDLLQDVAGSRSWSECRRVLNDKATMVLIGGPKANRWLGPLGHIASVRLASVAASQKVVFFVARFNRDDLVVLREILEAGTVTPVIDRRYPLSDVPEALRHLDEGHAGAKVVITV